MTPPTTTELTDGARRRAMRLSRFDAAVYALMVGLSEAYFLADAVRLGASSTEIALLVGLPLAIGATGPVLALRVLARLGRRKPIVVGGALAQVGTLLALAALDAGGATTVRVLIGASIAYQVCAQCAGTAWSSWFGDLVPASVRGRYFATRNRGAYAGTLAGLVVGGLLLARLEPARAGIAGAVGGQGFALVYLLAALCRLVSVALLATSGEGRFSGMPDRARVGRYLRTGRGTGAWRLVLLVGLLQVAVYVASPFFNPYMLADLEFTYVEYMLASAAVVIAKMLVLPLWGRTIDRHGARPTLLCGALLIAIVPLPWSLAGGLGGVLLCQALSGAAWSGFEVGHFSMLLELGYRRMRPTIFATQSIVAGSAQLVGGLIGSALFALSLEVRSVFLFSAGLRVLVVLLLIGLLPKSSRAEKRARPALRLAGFRPGAGMAQRPVMGYGAVAEEPDD